jgi:hypothetical protein
MRLEQERAFSPTSPVGRYWLRNCVGFHVDGMHGPGIVEEIGLGPDGVDVLAVRRRGLAVRRIALVPAQQVESIHPWDDTIVVASRHRRARALRAEQTKRLMQRLRVLVGAAAVETMRALRDGAIVVQRMLAALGTLLLGVAAAVRKRAPNTRRHVAGTSSAFKVLGRAYAVEARRAWSDQKDAIAEWRRSRRDRVEEPGDHGPLTRAGADEFADAHKRETARR